MSLPTTKHSLSVALIGIGLVLAAFFLPTACHIETVVPAGLASSPEKNLIIVRTCCLLDGLLCLLIAWSGWRWKRMDERSRIEPKRLLCDELISKKTATIWVVVIAAVGLVLRTLYLDTSFWLDEITPLTFYRETSVFGLLTTYFSTNNHLLYTLLEKIAVSCFGEQEWVVRLPAVLFGVATIPIMYLLTRLIAPRWIALSTAFLLSDNYQHVFFSQNARGYSAHLFFSLAATLFIIRGIKRDKALDWLFYCLCMFCNLASIIASLSVLIAHFVIAIAASFIVQQRSGGGWPLFRRLSSVIFLTLLMVLHLYSIIFPQAYAVVQDTYHIRSTGFALFSSEFLNELARGLKLDKSPLLLCAAIPGLLVAGFGMKSIFRCSWILLVALSLPELLLAGYLLKLNLAVSPRFFLLALPFGIVVCAVGIYEVLHFALAKMRQKQMVAPIFFCAILCVSAVSLPSLLQSYRIPKQDFRSAVLYLKSKPEKIFPLSIYTAKEGFAYYANKDGWQLNRDFFDARTIPELDQVLKLHKPSELYLVTTFARALHLDHPELEPILNKNWVEDRVFPGSIGDGDITVWKPRQ